MAAVSLALQRMKQLAMCDGLTGLFNRLGIEQKLEHIWNIEHRSDPAMTAVVLDIDHFKVLNDTYGHAVGDQAMQDFARLMQRASREGDVLARTGGDEFLVILPHANSSEARAFCDRLLHETREHIFCPDTHRLNLTVSMGLASSDDSTRHANAKELISEADRALYWAKRSGRNRFCVWGEEV